MDIENEIKSTIPLKQASKTVVNMLYTSRIVEEKVTLALKAEELTHQQFNVLRILRGQKGNPANLSTIQERMIDKSSNTTRLIDKLILKKFVKRQICKNNRRKIEVFITPEGLKLLEKLDPIIDNTNQKIVINLSSEELYQLNNLLDKLRTQEKLPT